MIAAGGDIYLLDVSSVRSQKLIKFILSPTEQTIFDEDFLQHQVIVSLEEIRASEKRWEN